MRITSAASTTQLIPEPEVSDVSVARILTGCFLDCKRLSGDVLHCRTVAGMGFCLSVRDSTRLLHVFAHFATGGGERAELDAVVARINDAFLVGRAALDAEGDLVMDLVVSYAGGLVPAQLIHTLALFERSCTEARQLFARPA